MEYAASGPAAFHMPGHKLGKGIPSRFLQNLASLDLTEIPGTDNLHFPRGVIREAQELAAAAFGADDTFFLVNGSTCGIYAIIASLCNPGDKLIIARDCHRSAINGMMLAEAEPIYIKPRYCGSFGISTVIEPADVERLLKQHPDAKGVFITRPNYYGNCSDIEKIAQITHSYGKVLAVDEAHGAHLKFSGRLPICAMQAGADICVQSAHKTLPALTQGAYLHVKSEKIDLDRLKFYLNIFQTSSPSYIIMAMLDIAREIMEHEGARLLDNLLDDIKRFKTAVEARGILPLLAGESEEFGRQDETRIVVNFKKLGITGYEAERALRCDCNIQVEMSDIYNIVCITTIADSREDLEKLYAGLDGLIHRFAGRSPLQCICEGGWDIPERKMSLRHAMRHTGAWVGLDKAAGRISRGAVAPYPPGIPVVCPGEIIVEDIIHYVYNIIKEGGIVHGINENLEINVVE